MSCKASEKLHRLRPVMFVGTCSDAGKSLVNTAFCRILKQDGYTPVPFKAQNMSLNSYCTPEGGEIGRAQAVQAEACGLKPHTDMNPVLLKPTTEKSSQIILNGHPVGAMTAREYFGTNNRNSLFNEALAAFRRLNDKFNPVVLEGAGSIAELNIQDRDIANMRMAGKVGAAVYLVADIDRGGVFASVYGSVMLLPEAERKLIKGIIINKFRGDVSLFKEGCRIIRNLTGIPVVGVLPYFRDIHIEEEDAVALEYKERYAIAGKINIAVVLFPGISNFTDFDVLEKDERFHLFYTDNAEEIECAEIIVLPGTKNTIADLKYIRSNGIADAIVAACKAGRKIVGICGGYQMMGMKVEDPQGVEGKIKALPGLGLLPLMTRMEKEKITCQNRFRYKQGELWKEGYQIHMGKTWEIGENGEVRPEISRPLNLLDNDETDGYLLNDHCWGTYMHGIFDHSDILDDLAEGFTSAGSRQFDYMEYKQQQYDRLAAAVREAVDMDYIYSTLYF